LSYHLLLRSLVVRFISFSFGFIRIGRFVYDLLIFTVFFRIRHIFASILFGPKVIPGIFALIAFIGTFIDVPVTCFIGIAYQRELSTSVKDLGMSRAFF